MARLFHPDMHPEDTGDFTAKFQEITEAYETLSDHNKKEIYDQQYREIILEEAPSFESYYYIEPQEYHDFHQTYEPPKPKKRNTYAPYGGVALLIFLFLKMISNVSTPEAAYNPNAYVSPNIQHLVDSLQNEKNAIEAKDSTKVYNPEKNPFQTN